MLDGESRARWLSATDITVQEGAALRLRQNSEGSIDAITVTKNIWLGAVWIFDEHIWNTGDLTAGQTVVFDHRSAQLVVG